MLILPFDIRRLQLCVYFTFVSYILHLDVQSYRFKFMSMLHCISYLSKQCCRSHGWITSLKVIVNSYSSAIIFYNTVAMLTVTFTCLFAYVKNMLDPTLILPGRQITQKAFRCWCKFVAHFYVLLCYLLWGGVCGYNLKDYNYTILYG